MRRRRLGGVASGQVRPVRVVLVANPDSGSAEDGAPVVDLLRARGLDVAEADVREVCSSDDPAAVLRAHGAFDRVIAAGGDGTLAPAALAAGDLGVPFAVVPTGTANDFARALEIPKDREEAVALAADENPTTTEVELAFAGARPFLNVATAGLSVLAARRAHDLKPRLGTLAYGIGALRAAASGSPLRARVTVDGEEAFEGEAWQVMVAATGAFGGGSALAPADPHDGLLDVAVLRAGPRLALARRAAALRFGDVTGHANVVHARGRSIDLALGERVTMNVDGEVVTVDPAHFTVRPDAVRVVVPASV